MKYDIEVNFYKSKRGDCSVQIDFGNETMGIYNIASINSESPDCIEFTFDIDPGEHPISVTYLNKEFVDTDDDINAVWCNSIINDTMLSWKTMTYDEIFTADTTVAGQEGWHPFTLDHQGTATTYLLFPDFE